MPLTKFVRLIAGAGMICLAAAQANATPNAETKTEISHLLQYIQNSNCQFIRNKKPHDPDEAVAHIQKKYDHFEDDIVTAEDFIEKSASGSLLSGKKYTIDCPEKSKITSEQWLLDELKRYRKTN